MQATDRALEGYRICTKCQECKPVESFKLIKDKSRETTYRRARCLVCEREQIRKYQKERREKYPDAVREYKNKNARENRAKKKGVAYVYVDPQIKKEKALELRIEKLQELNAKQAFDYWIKIKATNEQAEAFFRAMGKPWLNPRLTDGEKYKAKWLASKEFRIKERERQVIYKNANPEVIARQQDKRRVLIAANSDGSVNSKAARHLLSEFKDCPYCGVKLVKGDKALDHMEPVSKGGEHSVKNIIVCCSKCNLSKNAKDFIQWLEHLEYEFKVLSVWAYINKRMGYEIKTRGSPSGPFVRG